MIRCERFGAWTFATSEDGLIRGWVISEVIIVLRAVGGTPPRMEEIRCYRYYPDDFNGMAIPWWSAGLYRECM